MKKKSLVFLTFILIVSGIVFINACKKEKFTKTENEISQVGDKELSSKIISFRNDMLDFRKTSTNETMNFGEAIWMMEASFNFYHSFSDGDFLNTITDSVYIDVDYNNLDDIAISDLQSIFISANNTMLSKLESINLNNKRTILFDLELETTTIGNQLLCMMTVGELNTQKSGQSSKGSATEPFDSDDYWYPGSTSDNIGDAPGKCDNYVGQYVGVSDATFEQEKAARKYRRGVMINYYFVSTETHTDLWYNGGLFEGHSNSCISPTEMNEDYEIIGGIINKYYNDLNISQEKQFANIDIDNQVAVGSSGWYQTCVNGITFGVKRQRIEKAQEALYRLP